MSDFEQRQPSDNLPARGELIDPETRVADYNFQSGIKPYLERYYENAKNPEDRERCLELLTSLALTDAIKQNRNDNYRQELECATPDNHGGRCSRLIRRPYTSIGMSSRAPPLSSYTTSYARDYFHREPDENQANRPGTAPKAFKEPSRPMPGSESTTYTEYFCEKPVNPAQPIRSGTASGSRRNNPHPQKGFMVWKFPRQPLERRYESSQPGNELTDEVMDKVMRRGLTTIYRRDYLGLPQDCDKTKIFGESYDWKSRVPYTLDSTTRATYQHPVQPNELKEPSNRYGCNKIKHIPATGIIPKVTPGHSHHLLPRTSYEAHYQHPCRQKQPLDARDLAVIYGGERLAASKLPAQYSSRPLDRYNQSSMQENYVTA